MLEQVLAGLLDLDVARSEATTGLSMPLARYSSTTSATSFANTIGGVTIVCQ